MRTVKHSEPGWVGAGRKGGHLPAQWASHKAPECGTPFHACMPFSSLACPAPSLEHPWLSFMPCTLTLRAESALPSPWLPMSVLSHTLCVSDSPQNSGRRAHKEYRLQEQRPKFKSQLRFAHMVIPSHFLSWSLHALPFSSRVSSSRYAGLSEAEFLLLKDAMMSARCLGHSEDEIDCQAANVAQLLEYLPACIKPQVQSPPPHKLGMLACTYSLSTREDQKPKPLDGKSAWATWDSVSKKKSHTWFCLVWSMHCSPLPWGLAFHILVLSSARIPSLAESMPFKVEPLRGERVPAPSRNWHSARR